MPGWGTGPARWLWWLVATVSLGIAVIGALVGDLLDFAVGLPLSVLGALIVLKTGNRVGMIMAAVGCLIGLAVIGEPYVAWRSDQVHSSWLDVDWAAWLSVMAGVAQWLLLIVLPQVFPDGRLLSSKWRPVLWATVASGTLILLSTAFRPEWPAEFPGVANPIAVKVPFDTEVVGGIGWLGAFLVALPASLLSMVRRYQISGIAIRAQIKWVVFAFSTYAATNAVMVLTNGYDGWPGALTLVSWLLIPVATTVAILRHRLFDIDRLISRTVSFTLLAGVLTVVFVASVILIRALLPGSSSLDVAGSTLAVARLFAPLRRRVLAVVAHRFDRERFDAGREVEAFAERLHTSADADGVIADLTGVVTRTLRPTAVSVWTTSPPHHRVAKTSA